MIPAFDSIHITIDMTGYGYLGGQNLPGQLLILRQRLFDPAQSQALLEVG